MQAKDLKIGQKFRRLIDLEPGETVDMLPVMIRVGIDISAFTAMPLKPNSIPVLDVKTSYISRIGKDTEVETL